MKHLDRLTKNPRGAGNMNNWQERHLAAVHSPRPGFERPVVGLLRAWLEYADAHRERYESGIGQDGVLGPEWAAIGAAIRGLLNGDCGALDCGTIDGVICDALKAEEFDPDNL